VGERHDDQVALLYLRDLRSDVLDDAYGLVAHRLAGLAWLHLMVRMEIAAADAGAGDADQRVGRLDDRGVGDVLDADVSGLVHNGCAHGSLPPVCGGPQFISSAGHAFLIYGRAPGALFLLNESPNRSERRGRFPLLGVHCRGAGA
jgi:hypothetical protein